MQISVADFKKSTDLYFKYYDDTIVDTELIGDIVEKIYLIFIKNKEVDMKLAKTLLADWGPFRETIECDVIYIAKLLKKDVVNHLEEWQEIALKNGWGPQLNKNKKRKKL